MFKNDLKKCQITQLGLLKGKMFSINTHLVFGLTWGPQAISIMFINIIE